MWLLSPAEADAALAGSSKEAQQKLLCGIDDYGRTPLVLALSTGKLAVAAVLLKYLGNTSEGLKLLLGVYRPAWRSCLHDAVRAALNCGTPNQPADLSVVRQLVDYASKHDVSMLGPCTTCSGTRTPLQAALSTERKKESKLADEVPRCPTKGHQMQWLKHVGGLYGSSGNFICNQCSSAGDGERWVCTVCSDDFCGSCKAPLSSSSTGAAPDCRLSVTANGYEIAHSILDAVAQASDLRADTGSH
eukprot:COSAG03_NODE_7379_length_926_cov_1.101572_1_plen_245_part_01